MTRTASEEEERGRSRALPPVTRIERDEVQNLVARGAVLVEVLAAEDYQSEHIPGALNLPLSELTSRRAREELDPRRPVVLYCADQL
jgi:rhodanese-related sulfurtransferase